MDLNRSQRIGLLAAAGSAAMLLGALGFQYLGDLPPCKLCIWQRWPHLAAVLIGLIYLFARFRMLTLLGALAALTTAGVGIYHTGVEKGWWEGPSTCTAGEITGMSADDLLESILATPVIRCDDILWEMFGLSMASWNAIISMGLALIWLVAWRQGSSSTSQ